MTDARTSEEREERREREREREKREERRERSGAMATRVLEFKAEAGEAKAVVSLLVLQDQLLVWVGDQREPPVLNNLHYAMAMNRSSGGGSATAASPASPSSPLERERREREKREGVVTTLVGKRFHSLGEKLAKRLSVRMNIPVVCSWNLRDNAAKEEELEALCNMLVKEVMNKYEEEETDADTAGATHGNNEAPPSPTKGE